MSEVSARPWFLAGFLHLGGAAALGLLAAAPVGVFHGLAHVLFALAGVFLIAGALAHGFVAPFLKREPRTPHVAHASLALVLVADALALLAEPLGAFVSLKHAFWVYGVAFALLPMHVALTAAAGPAWRGGIAIFAKDQPFREGDTLAATTFGVALLGLLVGGALLAVPPRGVPTGALIVLILAFALPFLTAFLLFILPRNAKRPLPAMTLHTAALVLLVLGAAGLAYAFAYPIGATFRYPAVMIALGHALSLTGFLRLDLATKSGPQLQRARPFLRGAFSLAALAPLVLLLATINDVPQLDLVHVALYVYLALLAMLSVAATLFGAPILLNAVPREGRWGAWSAGLAIAGLFLLAPAFQHARGAFPGALVLGISVGLILWGLAPMRVPRREC